MAPTEPIWSLVTKPAAHHPMNWVVMQRREELEYSPVHQGILEDCSQPSWANRCMCGWIPMLVRRQTTRCIFLAASTPGLSITQDYGPETPAVQVARFPECMADSRPAPAIGRSTHLAVDGRPPAAHQVTAQRLGTTWEVSRETLAFQEVQHTPAPSSWN